MKYFIIGFDEKGAMQPIGDKCFSSIFEAVTYAEMAVRNCTAKEVFVVESIMQMKRGSIEVVKIATS